MSKQSKGDLDVVIRLTVDEARELAMAAEAGVHLVYVYTPRVHETVKRLRDAIKKRGA